MQTHSTALPYAMTTKTKKQKLFTLKMDIKAISGCLESISSRNPQIKFF